MNIRKTALCGLCAAVMCLCAWLAVPVGGAVFTMQTFGVFFALMLLGGKYGTAAVLVYILLGAVGLPVFSLGQGGIGVLLGATGGYIWGFLVAAIGYRFTHFLTAKPRLSAFTGLLCCYLAGTLWYWLGYGAAYSLPAILLTCVVPYILPDILKILLADSLCRFIKKHNRSG